MKLGYILIAMIALSLIGPIQPLTSQGQITEMAGQENTWQFWTIPQNISTSSSVGSRGPIAIWPVIAVAPDAETVYAAWTDGRDSLNIYNIYYATSTNGGDLWNTAQPVSHTAQTSLRPGLAMASNIPWVTWADQTGTDYDTHVLRLTSGSTTTTVPNEHRGSASISRLGWGAGDELHLALQGSGRVLYSHTPIQATSWPTTTVVASNSTNTLYNPAMVVSSNGTDIHLVWQESPITTLGYIHYKRGTFDDVNTSWGAAITLSIGITNALRPAIALSSEQTIHVVWGEKHSLPDGRIEQFVGYTRSNNKGATWSQPAHINAQPMLANNLSPTDIAPALAIAAPQNVCVAWHGFFQEATFPAEEIYVACSLDGGLTWESPTNVSRSPNIISIRPAMFMGSDSTLHMVWQEYVGPGALDNYQIYYAHSLPYAIFLPLIMKQAQ